MASSKLAPLIAVVGCDGSGKSTLTEDLLAELGKRGPVARCYLGLGSGEMGNRIKRWPLIGPLIEARLADKARQTRTKGERIPGLATALVVYGFSLLRRKRFRQMLTLRRRGVAVVTDRYPQTSVHGFFDGPGLTVAAATNPFVRMLARRELALYEWMTSFRPDVVIRLNVDVETALARKPDHRRESIVAKVAATPLLSFGGAPIVDLSSLDPLPDVIAAATRAVDPIFAK